MDRFICVSAEGSVQAAPDITVVSLEIASENADYQKAVEGANAVYCETEKAVCGCGLKKEDMRTSSYAVESVYENAPSRDGMGERVFKGYRCRHSVNVRFDFDMKRLGELIYAVSAISSAPEIGISFTVKDTEVLREKAAAQAVERAKRDAENLCKAAGVSLGALIKINHSGQAFNECSATCFDAGNMMRTAKLSFADMTPEDVDIREKVELSYEIKA